MIKTADDMIREAQQHIECLDVNAAKKLYDENPDAIIIDVREADSVTASKLSNSIHISRGLIEMQFPKQCANANALIITHCGGGGRASLSANTLKQMGYTQVYAITAPYEEIKKVFG